MLSAALAWIPVIGPILQGIFGTIGTIYSKFKDNQLGMRQAEVQEAQISAQIIQTTNDSIGIRIMRDALCGPVVIWCGLISWDTIIGARQANGLPWHPDWIGYMFHVGNYPDSVSYLPLAVVAFLLGNIGINTWSRNRK